MKILNETELSTLETIFKQIPSEATRQILEKYSSFKLIRVMKPSGKLKIKWN